MKHRCIYLLNVIALDIYHTQLCTIHCSAQIRL